MDLALFANEARDRLLGLLGSEHSMPSVPALMRALAEFLRRQAEAVGGLISVGPGPLMVSEHCHHATTKIVTKLAIGPDVRGW